MNKFKDPMNRWRTLSLFKETAQRLKESVLYSFEEARGYYIECNDPTGYLFATTYFGGWKHFLTMKQSPLIAEQIELWEEELEIKLRSEALGRMNDLALGEKGYQANKFLIDAGWKQNPRGRPTKKEIEKNKRITEKTYDEFNNVVDMHRR